MTKEHPTTQAELHLRWICTRLKEHDMQAPTMSEDIISVLNELINKYSL
jgi:hypothetical protein